jgi:hypothetical protein
MRQEARMPDVEGRARLSLSPTARIHFSSSSLSRTMELVVAPLLEKHLATPHDWPLHDRVLVWLAPHFQSQAVGLSRRPREAA